MTEPSSPPLLTIEDLQIRFGDGAPTLDGIDFTIRRGEIVALVGESGSGKSLLAHTIAGILSPAANVTVERFEFGGVDLRPPAGHAFAQLRGREIGIVFQNPRAALSPTRTIGQHIADVIREHRGLRFGRLNAAVTEALGAVRIPEPAVRAKAYPVELSGGMCQRALVAMALAGNPNLLIADEPTTGLDTTTQAAILDLITAESRARHMATLLITHDLALARAYAERLVVMHAGQIVEEAPTRDLFETPHHPYSAALIGATPAGVDAVVDLKGIAGGLPDLTGELPACRFTRRCDRAMPRCQLERPPLEGPGGHATACWAPL